MKRLGPLTALSNAFQVLFQNFGIALFLAVIVGGLGWTIGELVSQYMLGVYHPPPGQKAMVISQLSTGITQLVWHCTIGSWGAPAAIYLWVQREKGSKATLYEAVNYGLNRMGRVFFPHALAFFVIWLGAMVIVLAPLFGVQYAFVDAIATLDSKERHPRARSRQLTAGRRGTIFRTFAPFALWWGPMMIVGAFQIQNWGLPAIALAGVIDYLVLIVLDLAMVQLYLDLFRKPTAAESPA